MHPAATLVLKAWPACYKKGGSLFFFSPVQSATSAFQDFHTLNLSNLRNDALQAHRLLDRGLHSGEQCRCFCYPIGQEG